MCDLGQHFQVAYHSAGIRQTFDEQGLGELCGKDHGFMPIVVIALPEDEFEAWVSEQLAGTSKKDQQVTVR